MTASLFQRCPSDLNWPTLLTARGQRSQTKTGPQQKKERIFGISGRSRIPWYTYISSQVPGHLHSFHSFPWKMDPSTELRFMTHWLNFAIFRNTTWNYDENLIDTRERIDSKLAMLYDKIDKDRIKSLSRVSLFLWLHMKLLAFFVIEWFSLILLCYSIHWKLWLHPPPPSPSKLFARNLKMIAQRCNNYKDYFSSAQLILNNETAVPVVAHPYIDRFRCFDKVVWVVIMTLILFSVTTVFHALQAFN